VPKLVPKLDLSAVQQFASPRLEFVAAFESAYRGLEGQDEDPMSLELSTNNVLNKYLDFSPVYTRLGEPTQAEFRTALDGLAKV